MYRMFSMIVIVTLLVGCAANHPKYTGADATCIQGSIPEYFKLAAGDQAVVVINYIDGISTGFGMYRFEQTCLVPGKHRLDGTINEGRSPARFIAEFDLKAGRRYMLRADNNQAFLSDVAFYKLEFLDITSEPKIKIREFELTGHNLNSNNKTYHLSD